MNALSARFRSSAVFEFNAAGGSGGALHFSGTCSNCKFASNSAVLGGAVFASGAVELTSNQVVRNRASEEGSAIYSIAELTVSDSLVANFINDLECIDTDNGATDENEAGCAEYSATYCHDAWGRDDNDFSSLDMCCACGGGTVNTPRLFYHAAESEILALNTVAFRDNELDAIMSITQNTVMVRNCDGIPARGYDSFMTCSSEAISQYCPLDYCVDAAVGIKCYCYPDQIPTDPNSGASCLSASQITVPIAEFDIVITKPAPRSHVMLFSNSGEKLLTWKMLSADNTSVPWNLAPISGNLSRCEFGNITFRLNPSTLHARAAPYISEFILTSNSLIKTTQSILITARLTVTATPDSERSSVIVFDADALTTSGSMRFDVAPVDSTGLLVRDAATVSYYAALFNVDGSRAESCIVTYHSDTDRHRGACTLPALYIDEYYLEVQDSLGARVGTLRYFWVDRCQRGYYRRDSSLLRQECAICPPSSVDCSADGSELASLWLKPGYFRTSEKETTIRRCPLDGACEGGNSTRSYCRKGHQGALCAECVDGYFLHASRCRPCAKANAATTAGLGVCVALGVLLIWRVVRKHFGSFLEYMRKATAVQLRVIWSTFQILAQYPTLLGNAMPPSLANALSFLSFMSFNPLSLTSLACAEPALGHFLLKLVFTTLSPVIVALCFVLAYFVLTRVMKRDHRNTARRIIWLMLLMMYLCLPNVCTVIFSSFQCDKARDVRHQ